MKSVGEISNRNDTIRGENSQDSPIYPNLRANIGKDPDFPSPDNRRPKAQNEESSLPQRLHG
jgi:hypothetical protein